MAKKTEIELALNSISWQLKRIADSLEEIETTLKPVPQLPQKRLTRDEIHTRGTK